MVGTTLIGLLDSVFHHIFESQVKLCDLVCLTLGNKMTFIENIKLIWIRILCYYERV